MSELSEIVRGGFDSNGCYLGNVEYILKLCDEAERLEDAAFRPLGLDEWVDATRRMLHEVYPEDVFTGVSGDAGPRVIGVIRKALREVDEILSGRCGMAEMNAKIEEALAYVAGDRTRELRHAYDGDGVVIAMLDEYDSLEKAVEFQEEELAQLRRLEDLLAAWVSLPRAGNQSMPAELRALYDAGVEIVAKRKAGWPGTKEAERG